MEVELAEDGLPEDGDGGLVVVVIGALLGHLIAGWFQAITRGQIHANRNFDLGRAATGKERIGGGGMEK